MSRGTGVFVIKAGGGYVRLDGPFEYPVIVSPPEAATPMPMWKAHAYLQQTGGIAVKVSE